MFSKSFYFIYLVLFAFKICSAQVLQFGTCVEVETMKFFSLEKFLGKWYEVERFPTWYEEYGLCAYKNFAVCGRRIEIEHGFVRDGIQFVLHVNSTYMPGDDAVFVIAENNIDPVGLPLSVIATDYTNYALVYGCKDSPNLGLKYISAWILSRENTLPPEIRDKVYSELNSIPYATTAYLEPVVQNEERCSYYWTAHVHADYVDSNKK